MAASLVDVRDLSVRFSSGPNVVEAVKHVSFEIAKGEIVALVGESGSGKTVSALSIMRLLPYPAASHPSGEIRFGGKDLLKLAGHDMREIRGEKISIIFQEPMTSLNPLHTIEKQVGEIMKLHHGLDDATVRGRVLELLRKVGLDNPERRLQAYPHQLSGGQRQRVMIAMALANEPDLLIADEPTTALDVTIQAQILELLKSLQRELGMAMLLITHDLGVVRRMADRVYVMSKGEVVEQGPTAEVFERPQHPYTRHLISAEPKGKPPRSSPNAPVVLETENLKVWFPIKRGLHAPHRRSRQGRRRPLAQAARRRDAGRGGRVRARARPRWGWRCCASSHRPGPSPMSASASTATTRATCVRCARRCRSSSRTLTVRCLRASQSARSSRKASSSRAPA